jgi:hypothetical protein
MSGLWRVTANLERVGDVRMIHYRVSKVSDFAYPTFGTVLFWCKAACEKLLSDLQRKQAHEKDMEYVKREIEFLEGTQADWEAERKKW